jgi:hypothetical protein
MTLGNSEMNVAQIVVDLEIPANSIIYSLPDNLSAFIEFVTIIVVDTETRTKAKALEATAAGGIGA